MADRASGRSSLVLGAALYGAISGLGAVLLMTLFETPFWYRFGIQGVVQWQVNEIMISKILSKSYAQGKQLRWAVGVHLFHGIVLGVVFAVILDLALPSRLSSPLLAGFAGLVYTVVLWMFVPFSFRNKLQRAGSVVFTDRGIAVSLLAHLVYGLLLGEILFILLG